MLPRSGLLSIVVVTLQLLLAACSFSQAQSPSEESYRPIRSPYPTFTPTPMVAPLPAADTAGATTPAEIPAQNTDSAPPVAVEAPPPTVAPVDTPTALPEPTQTPTVAPPRLVISSPLVNARGGPGTEYPIVTTLERGQEFDIVGKNADGTWWRFCCVDDEPAWVIDELADADGAVDGVPVTDAVAQVAPTATTAAVAPPPAAQPAIPAEPAPTDAPPPPTFQFELQNAEQFPENKLVRVFLYVFDSQQALEGYSVHVIKDGAELAVSPRSQGGQPSLTWPIADARQRFQNMKVEFPGVAAAGTWVVQLVDGGGNPVGPPATFSLEANDPNQELYVRYKKL
ncbi:MAG: hypothetical protein R2932_12175 [Caldilineaceae bacterium]